MNDQFAKMFPLDFSGFELYDTTKSSIENYYYNRFHPGGFVYAMLANDFVGACLRADHWNAQHFQALAEFMLHRMPTNTWGSYEKVNAWLANRVPNDL